MEFSLLVTGAEELHSGSFSSFGKHAHMHWCMGGYHTRWKKENEDECSSSAVHAQCIISRSKFMDYLVNWIFVWAQQRTFVVTVERRMIEQQQGRRCCRFSVIFGACFWKHKPNYHWDRVKIFVHTHKYTSTCICLLWASTLAAGVHCRILALSVCDLRDDGAPSLWSNVSTGGTNRAESCYT